MNTTELTLNELELGNGGTVAECEQLVKAFSNNPILREVMGFGAHIPGVNVLAANLVADTLKKRLHIQADIDLGWAGLGINSDPNTYVDLNTGKKLTHAQVLEAIRHYTA